MAAPGATLRLLGRVCLVALVVAACSPASDDDSSLLADGDKRWIEVPDGRLKTYVFSIRRTAARPILVVVVHGDLPNPTYHYQFAQELARRAGSAATPENLVAVGILRPGYADGFGDRSDGDMGGAVADNYTPDVIDAIAAAVTELRMSYDPRTVVLVGHSGGAAIVADLLGRYPEAADGALLVACGCDPEAWRSRMRKATSNPVFDRPNPSLMPRDMARFVSRDAVVRLIVGESDETTPPMDTSGYAELLRKRGIDVKVAVVPELGHNILFEPIVFDELDRLLHLLSLRE